LETVEGNQTGFSQAEERPPTGVVTRPLPETGAAATDAGQPGTRGSRLTLVARLASRRSRRGGQPQRLPGALAALSVAGIAVFFTALDQTVVVTALPQIVSDLQIPITQLDHASWIVSAYLLGFVIMMPLMGRVSDLYGRRRVFLLCLLIFGIGSLLCGLAPLLGQTWNLSFLSVFNIDTSTDGQASLIWLIAARFVQAIGGGALVPVTMAIAGDYYGASRLGLALGLVGALTEAGGAIGPLYGALIVAHLGWQAIFLLNVPIVLALLAAAFWLIPLGNRQRERIDWPGTLLLALALTCLSLGLAQQGAQLGPAAAHATVENHPIALLLALLFLVAFVLLERRRRHAVIDLALFKRLPFVATALVSLLVGAALIIALADIPIFIDTVLQGPVIDSGLALLRMTAMIPLGALLGGWLSARISCRLTAVVGLLFTAAGFYLMSRWPVDVGWSQITVSTLTAGLGFGLVIAPIGTTAINAVQVTQTGMSSAVVTALRMVGMMLGLAALTSWALAYFKALAAAYPPPPSLTNAAQFASWAQGYAHHLILSAHTVYSAVFFAAMLLSLVALLPALFLWGRSSTLLAAPAASASASTLPETTLAPVGAPRPRLKALSPLGGLWSGQPRRRFILLLAVVALLLLLLVSLLLTALPGSAPRSHSGPVRPATATPAGPHIVELALGSQAIATFFAQQLGRQQTLTDVTVTLLPNNGIRLTLNLHIDLAGLHRVIPVEVDGVLGLDSHQNIQLRILHLKRDGRDAGSTSTTLMQQALNGLLSDTLMPALRARLKGARLLALSTTADLSCSHGKTMIVLKLLVPPAPNSDAPAPPTLLCVNDTAALQQLFG
jgi:MFS family permease